MRYILTLPLVNFYWAILASVTKPWVLVTFCKQGHFIIYILACDMLTGDYIYSFGVFYECLLYENIVTLFLLRN